MRAHRADLIARLADIIDRLARPHPLRVAIDGRTASGKTSLADELAQGLAKRRRTVIRTSVDGFHRPRAERYRRGRDSAVGYLDDARDLAAMRRLLLDPLGPGGDRRYRTASFDLDRDEPLDVPPRQADILDVLIVDGTFLQRHELADAWDVAVFVETSLDVALQRGIERDRARLGGHEPAALLHARRYQAAFALYEQRCRPRAAAHFIVDNDDIAAPVLIIGRALDPMSSVPPV